MSGRDVEDSAISAYRPGLAIGAGLVIGAGLGISVGASTGDVAMGLVFGAGLGLVAGAVLDGFIRAQLKRRVND